MTHCKNLGCDEENPEFYPRNKSMCKKCISKKNKERKETKERQKLEVRQLSKKAEKLEAKLLKEKEKTKQLSKVKTIKSQTTETDKTLNAIIIAQQKMIEYQQKQADHLFELTKQIFESKVPIGTKSFNLDSESTALQMTVPSTPSIRENKPFVPPTPRRYKQLSHGKNRLDNDLF